MCRKTLDSRSYKHILGLLSRYGDRVRVWWSVGMDNDLLKSVPI